MYEFLERRFHLTASQTTVRTEILAGLTTFMTMSYIIFVQPAVLSTTGMDFQALLAATCIVSAIGCFLMALLASLGPGLWITALNVKYRDFRYVIPFLVQFGLYVSPVGFSSSIIPEKWRLLYSLNPIVGVIDGFRWSILGGASAIDWPSFASSIAVASGFLCLGIRKFRKMEKTFADLI